MRKNILAVLHHSCVADSSDARHILCPKTKDSWCKYQRLKLQNKDYKEIPGLPNAIKTYLMILKIFFQNVYMDQHKITTSL